ncbi:Trihelix transcription factor ENAP2 [Linum grandiflorum]
MPIREDCWSEEATATLVDAWGNRYLELNRGNLRQKDWKDVADVVNSIHGLTKKTYRTDVQCKNRIDTIKKKYKVEKGGSGASSWRFFDRMDSLIGSNFSDSKKPQKKQRRKESETQSRSLSPSRSLRNYSAVAAAAAAAESSDEEEEEEEEEEVELEDEEGEGVRRLAKAIERFGEVYERVESEKLRQTVDLEKQRMKFAKDLEMERMKIFTETQIQLEKMKKGKKKQRTSGNGGNGEKDY